MNIIRRIGLLAGLGLTVVAPAGAQEPTKKMVDSPVTELLPTRRAHLIDSVRNADLVSGVRLAPVRPNLSDAERQRRVKQDAIQYAHAIDYSGPRFGLTWLPKSAVDSLKNHNIKVGQTITQYGWQFEHEIHVAEDGPRVLNEWVFLAGGLESGVFLPSVTWLIGARDKAGNEFGVGPNGSVAGVGLAAAGGVTIHSGGINFPLNFAAARSKTGTRYSFLSGFTIH
ncbi:MAG TPA: hypothetical protein VIV65_11240 [Gemmatimonadaceae bacterium]|jgi:hypothetical protein